MSNTHSQFESFLPLRQAAVRLGVPAAWLRAEAVAGRLTCLRAGRRLLFNPGEVERALLARMQRTRLQEGEDES